VHGGTWADAVKPGADASAAVMLRVLAWPAAVGRRNSPYPFLLASALEERGVVVEEFSFRRLATGRHDVVHVHWPDSILYRDARSAAIRTAALIPLLRVARARGAKLVWTVHNLGSHERHHPRTAAVLHRGFLPQVDGWISLTHAGVGDVTRAFPRLADRPHAVIPSGHYASEYPGSSDRAAARRVLDIADDASVVLFFGQVRPYKNVPGLIRAFRGLDDARAVLVVAGRPLGPGLAEDVRVAAAGDARIRLRLDFVDPEDVQVLFRAADLAVLPYSEIFNSGSAVLAVTFGCPVLVPDFGALAELGQLVGETWVRTYSGELTSDAIEAALARGRPASGPDLTVLDWDAVASRTEAFYRRLGPSGGRTPAT
jgi:glycosyltransferase involved in cell wall biosynthesis